MRSNAVWLLLALSASRFHRPVNAGVVMETLSRPDTCNSTVKKHDKVEVHYVGSLADGSKFDSTWDRDEPFKFQMGVGQAIAGWEEGLLGMCVGERRRLTVPPELAYGDTGVSDIIPAGATLYFEVELLATATGPKPLNVFKVMDRDGNNWLSREEVAHYLDLQIEKMIENGDDQAEEAKRLGQDKHIVIEEIYTHEDKDRDGIITYEEFSGPKHDEL